MFSVCDFCAVLYISAFVGSTDSVLGTVKISRACRSVLPALKPVQELFREAGKSHTDQSSPERTPAPRQAKNGVRTKCHGTKCHKPNGPGQNATRKIDSRIKCHNVKIQRLNIVSKSTRPTSYKAP